MMGTHGGPCRARLGSVVLAFGLLSALCGRAPGQTTPTSWWVNLRSTGYIFQTEEIEDAALDRFAAYQEVDGAVSGLAGGRVSLRFGGRAADDLILKRQVTDRARLFVGHAEARIDPRLTARLGRQFVQEGATGLTLDGLWLSASPARGWRAQLWGGARAPYDLDFKAGVFDEDAAWGARLESRLTPFARVAASWAYRERAGRVASRPGGLDGTFALPLGIRATGRAIYDFQREMWQREEALVQWQPRPSLPTLTGQVVDRRPAVDAASYFARFTDFERVRLGRASLRYETPNGFGAETEYVGSFLDDRQSSRASAAALLRFARVGYSVRLGDAGEENRFFGDASVPVLPWLRIEAGGMIEDFSFVEDPEDSDVFDLTSAFARVRAVPRAGMALTLEAQRLDNPIYESDYRFLAGLDLTMGLGTSRFGLNRGGWLR